MLQVKTHTDDGAMTQANDGAMTHSFSPSSSFSSSSSPSSSSSSSSSSSFSSSSFLGFHFVLDWFLVNRLLLWIASRYRVFTEFSRPLKNGHSLTCRRLPSFYRVFRSLITSIQILPALASFFFISKLIT